MRTQQPPALSAHQKRRMKHGAWIRASIISGGMGGLMMLFVVYAIRQTSANPYLLALAGGASGGIVSGTIFTWFLHQSHRVALWWMLGWAIGGSLGWYLIALTVVGLQVMFSAILGATLATTLSWITIGVGAGLISGALLKVVDVWIPRSS